MRITKQANGRTRINHKEDDCCLLIHDGVKVIALFECSGITETPLRTFAGTLEECLAEIGALGLHFDPHAENPSVMIALRDPSRKLNNPYIPKFPRENPEKPVLS